MLSALQRSWDACMCAYMWARSRVGVWVGFMSGGGSNNKGDKSLDVAIIKMN